MAIITIIASCCDNSPRPERKEQKIYKGHQWDLVKINDSIYIALPGLNAGKVNHPIMFNINKDETSRNETDYR